MDDRGSIRAVQWKHYAGDKYYYEKNSLKSMKSLIEMVKILAGLDNTHFLYMILDSKKTTRSQFSVSDLRDIHRNLKK